MLSAPGVTQCWTLLVFPEQRAERSKVVLQITVFARSLLDPPPHASVRDTFGRCRWKCTRSAICAKGFGETSCWACGDSNLLCHTKTSEKRVLLSVLVRKSVFFLPSGVGSNEPDSLLKVLVHFCRACTSTRDDCLTPLRFRNVGWRGKVFFCAGSLKPACPLDAMFGCRTSSRANSRKFWIKERHGSHSPVAARV